MIRRSAYGPLNCAYCAIGACSCAELRNAQIVWQLVVYTIIALFSTCLLNQELVKTTWS